MFLNETAIYGIIIEKGGGIMIFDVANFALSLNKARLEFIKKNDMKAYVEFMEISNMNLIEEYTKLREEIESLKKQMEDEIVFDEDRKSVV